jgi:DNA-3-methyladenine glycosylase II
MNEVLGEVTAEAVCRSDREELQKLGMTFRKADYIKAFAQQVYDGEFDLEALAQKSDAEVIAELTKLDGVGRWTAEMILIFCLQRPDVLSFGDLAIQRGLRMLYHHRKIDRQLFEKYRRRYSPYGTVASLYLWAIAGGDIAGMKDYAPAKSDRRKKVDNKK